MGSCYLFTLLLSDVGHVCQLDGSPREALLARRFIDTVSDRWRARTQYDVVTYVRIYIEPG